jgi:hypothetical protein
MTAVSAAGHVAHVSSNPPTNPPTALRRAVSSVRDIYAKKNTVSNKLMSDIWRHILMTFSAHHAQSKRGLNAEKGTSRTGETGYVRGGIIRNESENACGREPGLTGAGAGVAVAVSAMSWRRIYDQSASFNCILGRVGYL